MKNKLKKFKKLYKKEIEPRLKKKDKIYSKIGKINSEIDKTKLEKNKLDSEINKIDSESHKLGSKLNKIDSESHKLGSKLNKFNLEINKIYSEKNKIYSEILDIFHKFGKRNNCVVKLIYYDFKPSELKLKQHNKDKTGFLTIDYTGEIIEELFEEEIEKEKVIDGRTYVLKE